MNYETVSITFDIVAQEYIDGRFIVPEPIRRLLKVGNRDDVRRLVKAGNKIRVTISRP